ncbi:hypothetical protein T492DRAFT_1041487 [Pavlovales sp. CCMP2436]|nr:hypothetical protein T492DRAFT_1041487 [Pavlovales sp. CCMP2436]
MSEPAALQQAFCASPRAAARGRAMFEERRPTQEAAQAEPMTSFYGQHRASQEAVQAERELRMSPSAKQPAIWRMLNEQIVEHADAKSPEPKAFAKQTVPETNEEWLSGKRVLAAGSCGLAKVDHLATPALAEGRAFFVSDGSPMNTRVALAPLNCALIMSGTMAYCLIGPALVFARACECLSRALRPLHNLPPHAEVVAAAYATSDSVRQARATRYAVYVLACAIGGCCWLFVHVAVAAVVEIVSIML